MSSNLDENNSEPPPNSTCCLSGSKSIISLLVCSYGEEPYNGPVTYYLFYEWASKVTSIAFNVCLPLLISNLGDEKFPNQGKSIWSYTAAVIQIMNALSFLTFTAYFEFGTNRRNGLIYFSCAAAASLLVFILCVNPSTIYLACIAAIICKVSQSIASLAYDSLLSSAGEAATKEGAAYADIGAGEGGDGDGVSTNLISSKGGMVGYCAMIAYAVSAGILILIIYKARHANVSSLWIEGVLPLFIAGVWYGGFLYFLNNGLPHNFGAGIDNDDEQQQVRGESAVLSNLRTVQDAFVKGSQKQYENLIHLMEFPDCALYIFAFIFLTGAASIVTSVAAIVATSVLKAGIFDLAICAALAIIGALIGLTFFKSVVANGWLTGKFVLITNVLIVVALLVYMLFVKTKSELYISAVWGGTQVGSFGAFSRALFSNLVPKSKQSTFFSLLQFSQESTGWIPGIIIAAVTAHYNGSNIVYVRTTVITSLVEIAIGLPCLMLVNCQKGFAVKKGIDETNGSASVNDSVDIIVDPH